MSHLAYASQGTSTLRLATSIMTDVGNNKKNTLQLVLSSMESQGVNSNIADTFPKFKAECECYNSPLTSVAQPLLSRSQGPGGQHTGHHANIMQLLFQQVMGVFCCHWEAKFGNVQKVHRYNTTPKCFLHSSYRSGLTFSPYRYIEQIIWFSYR